MRATLDAFTVRGMAQWCAAQLGVDGGRDLFLLIREYLDQSDELEAELAEGFPVLRRRAECWRDGYRTAL